MDIQKLNEIADHAELIQKLITLVPTTNPTAIIRKSTITAEAQMIKELIASLRDEDEL